MTSASCLLTSTHVPVHILTHTHPQVHKCNENIEERLLNYRCDACLFIKALTHILVKIIWRYQPECREQYEAAFIS